ncbi:MAG: amidohydrolase family protein [Gammaproteobacteria bacterium]|nr:amidohydrolase family protein [Gammaproteobacteria bacterium]
MMRAISCIGGGRRWALRWLGGLLCLAAAGPVTATDHDVAINGGRVLDPETGLDAVRSVGIRNGAIVTISESPLDGAHVIDASGLVVAPGFIDLHAHGQDAVSNRFQAADGVTTALELEIGVLPLGDSARPARGPRADSTSARPPATRPPGTTR